MPSCAPAACSVFKRRAYHFAAELAEALDMMNYNSLFCAGVLTLLATAPCFAMASWFPASDGNGQGGGQVSHSAPGPVMGVGVSALVAAGYVWYRLRSRDRRK